MLKFLKFSLNASIFLVGRLTAWFCKVAVTLFSIALLGLWNTGPKGDEIILFTFFALVLFGAIHWWWMLYFYNINVLYGKKHQSNKDKSS